jgi:hypothetical protein
MIKSNKTKREDNAAMAAMLLVFGAPFLAILNIIDSIFGFLLVLIVASFFIIAFRTGSNVI